MRKPVRDSEGKITGWELIAFLCGKHKAEQQIITENKDMKFDFTGAVVCH
jgi:hypothetical protein